MVLVILNAVSYLIALLFSLAPLNKTLIDDNNLSNNSTYLAQRSKFFAEMSALLSDRCHYFRLVCSFFKKFFFHFEFVVCEVVCMYAVLFSPSFNCHLNLVVFSLSNNFKYRAV